MKSGKPGRPDNHPDPSRRVYQKRAGIQKEIEKSIREDELRQSRGASRGPRPQSQSARGEKRPRKVHSKPAETEAPQPAATVANKATEKGWLKVSEGASLEQRIHAWLDVLVYVWRRRTKAQARFIHHVRLTEGETAQVAQAVQRLSHGFTGNRRLVGKTYLSDPDLLGAYLLFYWPVSWAQAWTVLGDLSRRHGKAEIGASADIGSGPGPLTCAMFDLGAARVTALDHSPEALDLLSDIVKTAYGENSPQAFGLRTKIWDVTSTDSRAALPVEGPLDLIGFGHVLNELWAGIGTEAVLRRREALVSAWSTALSTRPSSGNMPPLILIIEPALKETTRNLLRLRDHLIRGERELAILGPCFFSGACPALISPEGTCHSQVYWETPVIIRRIATEARIGKDEVSMAWLALGSAESANENDVQNHWRVTGEALVNKAGRTRYVICGPTGRTSLSLRRGELQDDKLEAPFFALRRGDAIKLKDPVQREGGFGVGPETRIAQNPEN